MYSERQAMTGEMIALALLAHELDKERAKINTALEHPDIKSDERIRLEGMLAGIVHARLMLTDIAEGRQRLDERLQALAEHEGTP
jgi:hypothetical protein